MTRRLIAIRGRLGRSVGIGLTLGERPHVAALAPARVTVILLENTVPPDPSHLSCDLDGVM
jgi:hypothetical protein